MICFRIGLKRNLLRYVDGELNPKVVHQVETHLLDCTSCRLTVLALRDGRSFAFSLRRVGPAPDSWTAIESALGNVQQGHVSRRIVGLPRPKFNFSPLALAGWTLAIAVLSVNGWFLIAPRSKAPAVPALAVESGPVDLDGFQTVSVRNIQDNTRPHIVAEGKVAEVRIDEEDGDLLFKLVDEQGEQDKFIICEVIDPIHISAPTVGSKVRVYGVSRYDSQADHKWFEIHPVLSIEQLAR